MARETETLFRLVMNDHEFLCHDDVHNIERERPLMTSHVFWPFLTCLPTLSYYNVRFSGLSWTPLPTLISDVINGRSQKERCNIFQLA